MKIANVYAREILDSRGTPTVEATAELENGLRASASAPSGASAGTHEAVQKRDGGGRYGGKGVLFAVKAVSGAIADALRGMDVRDQRAIDALLIALDGTPNKSALGANAILPVSVACARLAAKALGVPMYRYLGGARARRLPRPMMNVLNGGAHADNNVDIQEFMLVPAEGASAAEGVRMGAEIYMALKRELKQRGLSSAVGDEGGFAPNLDGDEEALSLLESASAKAGYAPGRDVFYALDFAASGWKDGDGYVLPKRGLRFTRDEMIDYVCRLTEAHPILSVEDALHEDDFEGFSRLTRRLKGACLTVGDDLFVTNPQRIREGAKRASASAVIVKPNQIGTLTETLDAVDAAREAGMKVVVSHRSGDTTDDFLADLAVGVSADFLKSGAPARGERCAKYNRLTRIAREIYGEE